MSSRRVYDYTRLSDEERGFADRIRGFIDQRMFDRAMQLHDLQDMSYRHAYHTVVEERKAERDRKPQALDEQGECPECQRPFRKHQGRAKLKSQYCGHVLCAECRDARFPFAEAPCLSTGCGRMQRGEDWLSWEPTPELSPYCIGEVPTIFIEELLRRRAAGDLPTIVSVSSREQQLTTQAEDEDWSLFVPEN